MLDKIPEAIFEQTVQSIAAAIYSQPKLAGLREPVEKILYRDNFKHLTRRAFQNFLEKKQDKLPKILDDAFIRHEVTQRLLAAYIRDGNADAVTQIAHRYAEYAGESVTAVQTALNEYLPELRAVLIEDEIYGRIILAQDMSAILNELRDLRQANDSNFGDIKDQLDFIISILIEFVVKPPSPFANISAALSGTLYTQPGAVRNEQVPSMKQLVGRETIQKEIFDALSASGRVLIQGFGGEGKTALAAVLADDWLRANKGAVLWLRAGSAGAAALAEALAATFKAQEIIAKAPDEKSKLGLLKQILPQTPVTLLVLDDCWDGTALLAVVQAGIPGNIAVLATSRQVHEMPTVIEIPKLDETAALDLLKTHAENQIDKLAAAKELCQAVYGLPFAIEIAGINMKVNKWSASEMLAKVQAERLTLSKKWVEAGRENIAALIAASVNALPETAQNVFDAWGAFFVPTITPLLMMLYFVGEPEVSDEMLLQVRAIPEIPQDISNDELRKLLQASILQNLDSKPADAALQTLQQHGLATRIPPTENAVAHYRLHDLAYEYTGKNAHDEMRNRAVEACLRYTDRYKSPSLQNFAALRPELDQFMAAANFAMQQGRYAQVEQFSDMLYVGSGTGGFLALSGLYEKSFKLLEQARDAAKAAGNRHNEGNALGNLGIAYRNLGDYQQAIKYHEQALKISREIGDKRGEGNALGNLGNAYAALGDYQQAIKYHEQALDISREIGDRRGEGNRLGNLGNAYAALGDYQKAIKYHEQALDISREIGNKSAVGSILGNLGIAYADLGDYQQAIKYHEQALVIRREIGDRRGEGNDLGNLGNAYASLGDYQKAIEYYEQILKIHREIGDRRGEGNDLGNLGIAYAALGDYQQAIKYHEQALVIRREIGDRRGEGNDLGNLGNAYASLGDYQQAIKYYEQALDISREIGNKSAVGSILGNLGNAYFSLGDYQQAIKYHEQALVIRREIGDRRGEGNDLNNLGAIYEFQEHYEQALDYYQQAKTVFASLKLDFMVAKVEENIADVRRKMG